MAKPSKSTEIAVPAAMKEQMALAVTSIIKEKMAECIGEFNLARTDLVAHMERVKEDGYSLKDHIDDSKKLAERAIQEMHEKVAMARSAARSIDENFAVMERVEDVREVVTKNTEALLPRLQEIEIDHATVIQTQAEIQAAHRKALEELSPPIFYPRHGVYRCRYFLMASFKEIPAIKASLAPSTPFPGENEFAIEQMWRPQDEFADDDGESLSAFIPVEHYTFTNFGKRLGALNKIESPYDGLLPFTFKRVLPCRHDINEDHRHKHPDGTPFGEDDTCQSHDDDCHEGCVTCDKHLAKAREFFEIEEIEETPSE